MIAARPPLVRRSLSALIIAEFALTLVLLVGAGLMIKSFLRLLAVPKGFNPDGVLTLILSPSRAKYPLASPQRGAYFQEVLARIQTLPGVQSAGLTGFLPLAGPSLGMGFQIEGRPPFDPGKEPVAPINLISHDYFQTMGLQMRAGRPFAAQDGAEAPQVAIINETIARRFFPNENPIGHRLLFTPNPKKPKTIVGVVGDTRHSGLDQEVQPGVYLPYLQHANFEMSLVVRAASGQTSQASLSNLAAAIRDQVRAQDPNEPVNQILTMDQRLSDSVAPRRFQMLLLAIFAGRGAGHCDGRNSRRHLLRRQPANTRDRHSDGLRGRAERCTADSRQPGNKIDAERLGAGFGSSPDLDSRDEESAF
jgi:putative ABC transport system permease protein